MQLKTLSEHGSWGDEDIAQLVRDLAPGVDLDPTSDQAKVPVEFLADDARRQKFFEKMEEVLNKLIGP